MDQACRSLSNTRRHWLIALLSIVLLLRLGSLACYPLMDTTEARYGEIARKMASSGDWVTPWFDDGVPFWGKPPLSFWLSAASIKAFGVNELAVRLPSFGSGLGMLALVFASMRRRRGRDAALVACLVLLTTGLFLVCTGAVLTDTALALSVTLAMTAFWRMETGGVGWGYAFFGALGAGLLAKGPVVLPLVALPTGAFCIATGSRERLRRLPWLGGTALTLAIALPWYVASELKTPGFLAYFVVGEHWQRFTDASWSGHPYGSIHARPPGFIWVHLLLATLPWSPWLGVRAARAFAGRGTGSGLRGLAASDPWRLYLFFWAIAPAVLFTPAGSVLATYALPGVPAIALLVAELWSATPPHHRRTRVPSRWAGPMAAAGLAVAGLVAIVYVDLVVAPNRSQASLLSHVARKDGAPARLAYWLDRPFSAQFYSRGNAVEVSVPSLLQAMVRQGQVEYVVARARDDLPPGIASDLVPVARQGEGRHASVLWQVVDPPLAMR